MLNPKQIKTIQIVMIFFIVSTVMSVAYIIYASQTSSNKEGREGFYKEQANILKKTNDSLLSVLQYKDSGLVFVVPKDSLLKYPSYKQPLPDSISAAIEKTSSLSVKVIN